MRRRPFISVVLNTLNGEASIGAALDSLMRQTYPRRKYEIIVVNDGSVDHTRDVVKSYRRVRYIEQANMGIAAARNAGLAASKGDIFVGFDDDCIAEPDWLEKLAEGYQSGDPVGVGGKLVGPQPVKGFVSRYVASRDEYFCPQQDTLTVRKNTPVHRFWRYLRSRTHRPQPVNGTVEVTELYGANSSFPKAVLEQVGGWQKDMHWIEDRDLCMRIRQAYPGRPFYLVPDAIITNDPKDTLRRYLMRSYLRGPVNLAFHRKNHLIPPLFPFPILFALAVLGTVVFFLPLVPFVVLFLPLCLYFWWLPYAITKRQPDALLFAYLELAEETMVLAGLARGYLQLLDSFFARLLRMLISFAHLLAGLVLIVGWMANVLYMPIAWLQATLSLAYLLLVPGYFTWQALAGRSRTSNGFRALMYSVGLSLITLMVSGLVLNETYTIFGWMHPFLTKPILFTIAGVTAALAIMAYIRSIGGYRLFTLPRLRLSRNVWTTTAALLIGLLLPSMAVAGAITLNNNGSPRLAILTFASIGCLVLLMVIRYRQFGRYYAWFLYSICLALLLGTTMRGWNITGHDVMQEFQVFQLTMTHAAWHMKYYQDAYMACLSITILPTMLQKMTGIADPYMFKFVFQLFFALIAPLLYDTLKGFVSKRTALLATFIFIAFPTFLTDIMMLNRQETALLFWALAIHVGLHKKLHRVVRSLLGFIFLVAMVLSHYSTSYVGLAVLLVTIGLAIIWWVGSRIHNRTNSQTTVAALLSIVHPPVIIAATVVLIAWGSLATQTSANISETLQAITSAVPQILTSKNNRFAPVKTVPSSVAHYQSVAVQTRQLPAADYYPTGTLAKYPLATASETIAPLTPAAVRLSLSSRVLNIAYSALRTVYALVIEGLIVVGLMVTLFSKYRPKELPRQYILFGIGTLVLIGAQVYLPPPVINYGLTRVIQQGLLVLALPIILASFWLLRLMRIPESQRANCVAIMLVVSFLVLSGCLPALTGGYKPSLPLSNSGFYYQAYYTHQEEIAAARWLATSPPPGSRIYADEFMRRKLITYGAIFAQPTLVPAAIPIDSYVILGNGNTTFHQVVAYDGTVVIYFQPPIGFLEANKNLLYASNNVVIYK